MVLMDIIKEGGDAIMVRSYSREFLAKLTRRLNEYSQGEADRSLCKKLMLQKALGKQFTIEDLDQETLKTLCIKEMCTDAIIGAIFGVNHRVIQDIREYLGYTRDEIAEQHTEYILTKFASELEKELGESAFM